MANAYNTLVAMQKALSILGYPNPYHFSSLYANVKDCDMWMEAFRAKYYGRGTFGRSEFDRLLGHCGAVTDAPCMVFAEELIDAYPDAKVILVERDLESWHRSWCGLVEGAFQPFLKVLEITDPWWHGRIQQVGMTWMATQLRARNLDQAKSNAKEVYREHYTMIRKIVPEGKLCEYRLGSGWKPLCEFLGKPVPDVPFPQLNESQSISMVFQVMGKKAMRNSIRNAIVVFGALAIAWFVFF